MPGVTKSRIARFAEAETFYPLQAVGAVARAYEVIKGLISPDCATLKFAGPTGQLLSSRW